MKLIEFMEKTNISAQSQADQAALLCYFHLKNTGESCFDMQAIGTLFSDAGLKSINATRVKNTLIKNSKMRLVEGLMNTLVFNTVTIESYDRLYASWWSNYIDSSSELLDETKFCGKRGYLDSLIQQINCSYKEHCYDACAVIMRRLFEVLLIMSYQNLKIDNEIKDKSGESYLMLDPIINNAINNKTLNLSRIKKEFDTIRKVGNFSAHNIYYKASVKDIDDIKLSYRVAIEELYNKAGLL